ncbi:transposase [Holospora elegans]|uniref:transposase n=1 Tax=Holospora elegans TaxID=431043 RepID=UPI003570A21C
MMDHSSFHKSKRSRELIESVKFGIIFLSPYSFDSNPIEKSWANMKRGIECNILNLKVLFDTFSCFFKTSNST